MVVPVPRGIKIGMDRNITQIGGKKVGRHRKFCSAQPYLDYIGVSGRERKEWAEEKMIELKIYYKTNEHINLKFDEEIETLVRKYGLKRGASGYNLEDKVRDICFNVED